MRSDAHVWHHHGHHRRHLTTIVTVAVAFVAPLFSHGVKLAEFRQAWINEQRMDVADYLGLAREWIEAWEAQNFVVTKTREEEERLAKQREDLFKLATKALVIRWRIKMRINPLPGNPQAEQNRKFLACLDALLQPPPLHPLGLAPAETMWRELAEEAVEQSQVVFKNEWEVTKTTMLGTLWGAWTAYRNSRA